MNLCSFFSDKLFKDELNYPSGFYHSSDFSETEADILTFCGHIINELISKKLEPQNEEQRQILKVLSGQQSASLYIEKVFLKYLKIVNYDNFSNNN